jgi:hypothetical protein
MSTPHKRTVPSTISVIEDAQPREVLKPSVLRELKQAVADIKQGKNIYGPFSTAAEMREHMENTFGKLSRKK